MLCGREIPLNQYEVKTWLIFPIEKNLVSPGFTSLFRSTCTTDNSVKIPLGHAGTESLTYNQKSKKKKVSEAV